MATDLPARITVLRYDVFTERRGGGNPLAVVIDPPVLHDDQMQQIAAELDLSETVFVTARDGGGWHARIFTPAVELPFAGHPTIGAAIALADAELVHGAVVLHEGVGPVEVSLAEGIATLTTPGPPEPVEVADPGDVVAAVGLEMRDLHPDLGPRGWSAGVPFTMLGVRDADALARARLDLDAWRDGVGLTAAPDLYLLAPLEGVRGPSWRARMFGPGLGVPEDPATGSAAAAVTGYLAGVVGDSRIDVGWTIEQGVEMGRPSEIQVRGVRRGGELVAVQVGGRAVEVGRTELALPSR